MNTVRYAVSFNIKGNIEYADVAERLSAYGNIVELNVYTHPGTQIMTGYCLFKNQ